MTIPTPDAIPLPAPAIAFKLLLILTFLLHVIPMNAVLGGNLVVLGSLIRGRKKPDGNAARLGRDLSKVIPICVSWAVTLGVAPLLFVQVLYGQAFYTSSILIGWYWFSVIVLIILAYYGAYLLRNKWDKLGPKAPWVSLVVTTLFSFVAFLWVTNVTLHMLPEVWAEHYFGNTRGTTLFTDEPLLLPRFLHFVVGATAVTGLFTVVMGWLKSKNEPDYGQWVVKTGAKIFMFATMLQLCVGVWFLLTLPPDLTELFLGGNKGATMLLMIGGTLGLISLFFMGHASRHGSGKTAAIGIALVTGTLTCMLIVRQVLREAYLEAPGYVLPDEMEMEPQWLVLGIFAACFLWGIYAMVKLVRLYLKGDQPAQEDGS